MMEIEKHQIVPIGTSLQSAIPNLDSLFDKHYETKFAPKMESCSSRDLCLW
jgi:hypothetical protein